MIRGPNIDKMAILPKVIYRFSIITNQNSNCLSFLDIKSISEAHLEHQDNSISQNKLFKEKDEVGGFRLTSFNSYCKVMVIKSVILA